MTDGSVASKAHFKKWLQIASHDRYNNQRQKFPKKMMGRVNPHLKRDYASCQYFCSRSWQTALFSRSLPSPFFSFLQAPGKTTRPLATTGGNNTRHSYFFRQQGQREQRAPALEMLFLRHWHNVPTIFTHACAPNTTSHTRKESECDRFLRGNKKKKKEGCPTLRRC